MSSLNIESGAQLFSRLNRRYFLDGINPQLFPDGGPLPNQIIEVTGPNSDINNDVLIDFIVKNILPSHFNKQWKGASVVLINSEFQINLHKIIKVMEIHLIKINVKESIMQIIEKCLKNLLIINCFSLDDLKMVFHNLERCISESEFMNLVVIDNILSYYWISKRNNNMESYHQFATKMLEKVYVKIKDLNVLLIYGKSETTNQKCLSKVDYKIDVREAAIGFTANVTNYEKQINYVVPFKLDKILQF